LPRDVLGVLLREGLIAASADLPAAPPTAPDSPDALLLAGTDRERDIAQYRAALIGLYLHRSERVNLETFVDQYNAGLVSRPILGKLGTVGSSTFYTWVRRYEAGGKTPAAVMPGYSLATRKRGAGASLSELARHYLDFFWLRDSRPSMRSAWIEARNALPNEDIAYPTAARYLASIPAIIRDYKRHGISRMETMDLPFIERNMDLYHSMDQLVSDHHCFDFLVEKDGNLFRPWITAVQDFRSAKIVGFWPSVYPSSLSISIAFYLAVSRFGACKLIHIDNGKDYRSMILNGTTKLMRVVNEEGFLEEELVGIQGAYALFSERVTFARPYHGSSKGRMERTFGTFAEYFSRRMAGYVGSNTVERPEDAALYWRALNKKARRTDIYTWDDYVKMLASFIDFYNAEWSSEGNGMGGRTPDEVFAATAQPIRPVSPDILALAFSRADRRKVGRNGVQLDGINYWSDELIAWKGLDIVVRRQIAQPEEVLITDPRGSLICRAAADYFKETGDLARDNERLNATKKKALAMVRGNHAAAIAPPAGYRSLVDMAVRSFPIQPQPSLHLAAGSENDPEPRTSARTDASRDRERMNAFLDSLGKDE
jgi:hypothetical protein